MENFNIGNKQHKITMLNRQTCLITGVKDALSFDVREVILETEQGMLSIHGEDLHVARGGILEKGQIGLLEGSGAEAVVPLEHNKAWLSKVAEDLNVLQMRNPQSISNEAVVARLTRIIELLEQMLGMKVYLDSGALVGELAPAIDARMGRMYRRTSRGI